MAINKSSVFWVQLKKIIKLIHLFRDVQDTTTPNIEAVVFEIFQEFDADTYNATTVEGIMVFNTLLKASLDGFKLSTTEYSNRAILRLVEKEAYKDDAVNNIPVILDYVKKDMEAAGDFILENTVVVGTPTALGTNIGNGLILVTNVDGEGLSKQGVKEEVMRIVCTQDGQIGGSGGNEVFQLYGEEVFRPEDNRNSGSGNGTSLNTATSISKLTNGKMENFTNDAPDSWDIDLGDAGVQIFESTTQQAFGDACLHLKKDLGIDPMISQDIHTKVAKNKKYLLSVMAKFTGITTGKVILKVIGDGIVYTGAEIIEITVFPAGYTRYNATFNIPNDVPDDLRVEIYTETIDAAGAAYIDDVCVAEYLNYKDNLYLAMTRGLEDFVTKDEFTLANTNDYAGNLNTFLNDFYTYQMPTAAAGVNTVDDNL